MKKRLLLIITVIIFMYSCYGFLPSPTKKKVKINDIVGIWKYRISKYYDWYFIIELKQDGTFKQTVYPSKSKKNIIYEGKWYLSSSFISIKALAFDEFEKEKGWHEKELSWWIIDDYGKNKFCIFGAMHNKDPDDYHHFKKVNEFPKG